MKKKAQLQRLTANFSGLIRHDTMEGKEYIVAPMVMLTEGVHAGSNGALFYPADEIGRVPQAWNSKPVTVYHPSGGSACTPAEITARKVGVIMNTQFEDGKLKAEAWLDADRLEAVDDRILEAIENETVMELSTGLFTENEQVEEADWNGEKYEFIARNHRPDHLAILPDIKGACSIDDGAGFLRLNELSHGSIRSMLASAVNDSGEDMIEGAWIEEVFDDSFIFSRDGDQEACRQSYMIKNDEVVIVGDAEKVVRVTEFRTEDGKVIGNQQVIRKAETMKKSEIIDALIANDTVQFTKADRPALVAMDKKILEKMLPVAKNEEEEATADLDPETGDPVEEAVEETPEEEAVEEDAPEEEEEPEENTAAENMTTEQYLKTVPKKYRSVLNEGLRAHNEEKTKLINVITANDNNTFSEKFLRAKGVSELRQIAALAQNVSDEDEEDVSTLNYAGQADPVTTAVKNEDALIPPSMGDMFPRIEGY